MTAAVRGPHNAISFGRLRRFIIEKRGFILAEMAVRVVAAERVRQCLREQCVLRVVSRLLHEVSLLYLGELGRELLVLSLQLRPLLHLLLKLKSLPLHAKAIFV